MQFNLWHNIAIDFFMWKARHPNDIYKNMKGIQKVRAICM